jgi:hypothetical protein
LPALGLSGVLACGTPGPGDSSSQVGTDQSPDEAFELTAPKRAAVPLANRPSDALTRDGHFQSAAAAPAARAWCNALSGDGGCAYIH